MIAKRAAIDEPLVREHLRKLELRGVSDTLGLIERIDVQGGDVVILLRPNGDPTVTRSASDAIRSSVEEIAGVQSVRIEVSAAREPARVRVFQWEVDSDDPSLASGSAEVRLGKWDYTLGWHVHPDDLVYASIQSLQEDRADAHGAARLHPTGRNVAVNLVYDRRRHGIVAIYGTAREFQPFVEAFARAYGIGREDEGAGG